MTPVEKAKARLAVAQARVDRARGRSEAATPGGLTNYDPAVLSGIRRKRNGKADSRRFAAYSEEAAAYRELEAATRHLAAVEKAEKRDARDRITKAGVTPETLRAATHVRAGRSWWKVIRVNAKTVTVESFADPLRFKHEQILEVREIREDAA